MNKLSLICDRLGIRTHDVLFTVNKELRGIIILDGICSHLTPVVNSLGELNSLRFSQNIWESNFMANSGFYTNRLRYSQFLELFREAGCATEVVQIRPWDALPTPKPQLFKRFIARSDEELSVYSFSVILQPV